MKRSPSSTHSATSKRVPSATPITTGSFPVEPGTPGTAQLYPTPGRYDATLACSGAAVTASPSVPNPVVVGEGQASPITFTISQVNAL